MDENKQHLGKKWGCIFKIFTNSDWLTDWVIVGLLIDRFLMDFIKKLPMHRGGKQKICLPTILAIGFHRW